MLDAVVNLNPFTSEFAIMVKFEYKVIETSVRNLEEELNKFGAQGWEMAAHSEVSSIIVGIVMKRPQVAGTLALLG